MTCLVIRMTTPKGVFYWTGSGSQNDVAGQFRTLGWIEDIAAAKRYALEHMAKRIAQRLHGDHARLFACEVDAVPVTVEDHGLLGVFVEEAW